MPVTLSSSFRGLPPELILQIFDAMAAESDISVVLSLALVASWVRTYLEKYIYHTVILPTAEKIYSFAQTVAARPSRLFATNVRRLWIASRDGYDLYLGEDAIHAVYSILSVCSGVVDVTIDQCYLLDRSDFPCRPRSISFITSAFIFVDISSRILDGVTHLYLINGQLHPDAVCGMTRLPALTHLAVSFSINANLNYVLNTSNQLLGKRNLRRLWVLPWQTPGKFTFDLAIVKELARLHDPRIVVISESIEPEDQFAIWEAHRWGLDFDRLWRRTGRD